jgi:F0F1-type ATP synthase assembly protein I
MISHLIALLVGFIAGLLVYRKHAEKLKAAEAEARAKADAIRNAVK